MAAGSLNKRPVSGKTKCLLVLVGGFMLMSGVFSPFAYAQTVVTTVGVGTGPFGVAYDAGKKAVFVTNNGAGTVSVISDSTNTVKATISGVGGGFGPYGIAYDSGKGEIFVASGVVFVISDSTNSVIASIPIGGSCPTSVAYDSGMHEVFVGNDCSSTVSVISDSTNSVVATIGVGGGGCPIGVAYDSGKGEVFVSNSVGSVSIISDATNTITHTVGVGGGCSIVGLGYDSVMGEVFVANPGAGTVSVISDSTNTVVTTITVGSSPNGIAYDPASGEVFVTNGGSNTVSVISDASNAVISTVAVGSNPVGVAYDSGRREAFVANNGAHSVTVISGGKILSSPNAETSGGFGLPVSTYNNLVAVGAPAETVGGHARAGRVYLFTAATGTPVRTFVSPSPGAGDNFGDSIALTSTEIVIGEPGAIVSGHAGAGYAYVFSLSGALLRTLSSPSPTTGGQFGASVALTSAFFIVGAQHEKAGGYTDSGNVYAFNSAGTLAWTFSTPNPIAVPSGECGCFGSSVSAQGYVLAVSSQYETVSGAAQAGRAYVFNLKTGVLSLTLVSPNSQAYGYFGNSISLSAGELAVGAPGEAPGGVGSAGRAYVFSASTGALVNTYASPNAQVGGYFGFSVGLSGGTLIVGAPQERAQGVSGAGAAYQFSTSSTAVLATLTSFLPDGGGSFGRSVSVSRAIIIGAPDEETHPVLGAGNAYLY
jgi:YVTN family beta-propeller protein